MSIYTVKNLEASTSKEDQQKLTKALKGLSGVKDITLAPERKEFSLKHEGQAPSFDSVKNACSAAGFQIENQK